MDSTPGAAPEKAEVAVAEDEGPEVVADWEHPDYSSLGGARRPPRKETPSAVRDKVATTKSADDDDDNDDDDDDDGIIEGADQGTTPPSFGGEQAGAARRRLHRLDAKRGGQQDGSTTAEKTSRSFRALVRNSSGRDDDNGQDDMHAVDNESWTSTNWMDRAIAENIPGAYGVDRRSPDIPSPDDFPSSDDVVPSPDVADSDDPIVATLAPDEDEEMQRFKERMEAEMVVAEVVKKRSKWLIFIGAAVCVVAVVVGTTLGVRGVGVTSPTSSPTFTTASYNLMVENIGDLVTSDPSVFENNLTSQYAAMDWLANSDGWAEANNILDSTDHRELVERYALALLYYSTNGNNWLSQSNFLEPISVCNWTYYGDGNSSGGASCGHGRFVRHLDLCK